MRTKKQRAECAEHQQKLRDFFAEHGVRQLFTVVRHVAVSGMSRHLDVYAFTASKDRAHPITRHRLTWSVATALGWRYNKKREVLVVEGCGMDMCFHTVYTLGRVLYSGLPRSQWPVWADKESDAGYLFDKEDL